jgi:hypothetical protein
MDWRSTGVYLIENEMTLFEHSELIKKHILNVILSSKDKYSSKVQSPKKIAPGYHYKTPFQNQ